MKCTELLPIRPVFEALDKPFSHTEKFLSDEKICNRAVCLIVRRKRLQLRTICLQTGIKVKSLSKSTRFCSSELGLINAEQFIKESII